tara:strand:+ start:807 stop:1031 length:225 start_codon:yes stop_codon:yes gene_type:complete
MPSLEKFTKAQLIDLIQQQEEDKYAVLKEELGLPYHTDEEWVEYIKSLSKEECPNCKGVEEEVRNLRKAALRCY